MSKNNQTIWFPAKKYGWGWGLPIAKQGWIVVVIYFAFVAYGVFSLINHKFSLTFYFLYFGVITILLIIVCYLKGEKPKWRWG